MIKTPDDGALHNAMMAPHTTHHPASPSPATVVAQPASRRAVSVGGLKTSAWASGLLSDRGAPQTSAWASGLLSDRGAPQTSAWASGLLLDGGAPQTSAWTSDLLSDGGAPQVLAWAPRGRTGSAGFTLIELLLAVSIFSVIAIAGVYVLRQAIVGSEQQIAVVNSTSELQQALWLMSQDMYNLIDREAQVGDKTELPLHTKQEGEDNPLGDKYQILFNLTRLSWIDTRYKYTSQLLRVAYALKLDSETGLKQLVRLHWPYVDRTRTQKPLERVLINGVREAEVSFYSEGKKDIKKWPLEKPKKDDAINEDAPPRFPDGLKFSLNIDGFGKFEKIISVNLDTVHVESEKEEGEDEDGNENNNEKKKER